MDFFSEKNIVGPHGVPDPPSLAQITFITVQIHGMWLTWNICTGGMGYARDAGMY